MPSWLLKAGVQGAISLLPSRTRLNHVLQERVTGNVALTEERFEKKVAQARRHLRNHAAARPDRPLPAAALELGTGWHPVVPVALALCGVERVVSVDIAPLTDGERTRAALARFADRLADGRLAELLPGLQAERAQARLAEALRTAGDDPGALLAPLGVELRVGDARRTGLPAGSFDLFVSNNTLEHIPPAELRALMAEFARLARPRAVMDHFIDMRDHYSGFDSSISRLNYLRYPERVWRLFNNRLHYQNRLRVSDYRAVIEAAGFTIVAEKPSYGRPHEFDGLVVHREFRDRSREDLFTLFTWLTGVAAARPADGAAGG